MKKLLIFLMIAIPLVVILVVNLTVNVVTGLVSVSVDSISLNETQIEATIDDVISLEATILPKNATNQDVIWQSTNEEVAKVDLNGNITFVGFGNGYITATTVDGNKRASCYFYATDTKVHQIILNSVESQNGNYFVKLDGTLQLSSAILPMEALDKNVIYTSEDETVATVDSNGLVCGLKEGRVKITSTSQSRPEISDSVIVEVVRPVESVTLSTEKAVTSSNMYQISYSISPSDATVSSVTYSSKDETIATVNASGVVSFLKPGAVVIEVTSVEGQKKAEIEIEYTNGYAYDLLLDTDTIEQSINQSGAYIQYTTIPQSVDCDVEFLSDDENVAYVDDSGYVQFIGGGNTLVRARIKKSEDEWIEKVIRVHIESPATDIIIENNFVVATKEFKLTPTSYPSNSTNQEYYFFSNDTSIATVDQQGVVTFLKDDYVSVEIDVYANHEKNVIKKVKITYTKGYPTSLELIDEKISLLYGDVSQILYKLYPANVNLLVADVQFKILQEQSNDEGKVIEILSDGSIRTLGGGKVTIEVSCLEYNQTRIRKTIEIEVERKVEDVEFVTNLELVNDEFVTCSQKNSFELRCLTKDATNKNTSWELLNNIALKSGENEITFNTVGVAQIKVKSEDQNFEKIVYVRYLKSNLVEATLSQIPKTLDVGEVLQIDVLSQIPSNATPNLSLKVSNQITTSELAKVIEVESKNSLRAVAGGSFNLAVIVANLQFNFTIQTIKKAEEIVVTPSNMTTTKDRLVLMSEVLPTDASNKNVRFEVLNEDVAYFDSSTLVFKKEGVARILATCEDGSNVKKEFTIEKVVKGTGDVSFDGEKVVMQVGETNLINLNQINFEFESKEYLITSQSPLEIGKEVISINNDTITAVSLGQAKLSLILTNKFGEERIVSIDVEVVQISEDVEFAENLDVVLGEYVTATENVALNFNLLPSQVANKNYFVRLLRFSSGISDAISPYISENQLVFASVGVATVEVRAEDEGIVKNFKIRYTGGDALDANLNVLDEITLNIDEEIEINVTKWIPANTTNKQIYIRETSHSQGVLKVVEINSNKIKAVAGGESRILVELSKEITKEIKIIVARKIESIVIDEEMLVSSSEIALNPSILPTNATNKVLLYNLEENDIAYLDAKKVIFSKPGTVYLNLQTTDGSNISKRVKITSTFGYIEKFSLNISQKDINKSEQFNLFVKDFYPSEAEFKEFSFKVLSSTANDGSENDVISVTENGLVTALYGGVAVVRVYTKNYYDEEVYADCQVNVNSALTSFDVLFERELQTSQGSFVTSLRNLGFSFNVYPNDAKSKEILCESSNEEVAVISQNQIKFLKEGMVVIKFTANDQTNGIIYKSFSIYFTDGKLLSLEIDEKDFDEKVLVLDAEKTYTLVPKTYLPLDVESISYSITEKNESRVDVEKPVISFDNGKVNALNGGEVSFTLYANDVRVERYTIKVLRKCKGIVVDVEEAYVNTNTYQIVAKAAPSDTTEKELKFEVVKGNGSVSSNGLVTLGDAGVVEIKVSSVSNEDIFRIVRVEYANQVKRISFKQTVTQLYMGTSVDLTVVEEPFNVEQFEVKYTSSDESIATVTSFGRVLAKEKAGEVTIRACVVGKEEIFTERTFTIVPILANISLELDNENDKNGIGGYRVWGNLFYKNQAISLNSYQMKISSISPSSATDVELIWSSSNLQIATVDNTGLVKFFATGEVTISVEPEIQYNKDIPVRDSYTFKIVEGLNVYSADQMSGNLPIVLQNNIEMKSNIILNHNLYGNGYMLDFTNASFSADCGFVIYRSNVLVDNVIIRGTSFKDVAALSTLINSKKVVKVRSDNYINNVVIRNSIIENGKMCVEVVDADVKILGCIIRNSCSAGLVLTRKEGTTNPPNVYVKDCIFGRSLFSSILINLEDNPQNVNYRSKLSFENIKIYNWVKASDFKSDLIEEWVTNASGQIIKNLNNYPQYKYRYNGEDYFMLGISKISLTVSLATVDAIGFNSIGDVVPVGQNPYTRAVISGSVTDIKYVGLAGMGRFTLECYTLKSDTTFITPGSTYEDDPNLYKSIQQKFS